MPPTDPPQSVPAHVRPFRLTRYFSLASLLGVLVVLVCMVWTYRQLTLAHLIEHESRSNANLTRSLSNDVWTEFRSFVVHSAGASRDQLLAHPAQDGLLATMQMHMAGLSIAKIKIYNASGVTVFSTERAQVGEDKSANQGFRRALAGETVSDITYRDRFDAFEGTLTNRNLIFSYVPVRAAPDLPPEAVFEVYSDVTALLARQREAQWQVAGIVLGLMGGLYLFMYAVVRKADRIIVSQEEERALRETEIRHQAYHDALTGLPNRVYFGERLDEALANAGRRRARCALMFIDLDRFKIVNDSLGHNAGDRLLKAVSDRIRACLRSNDLLFRVGGDEFTVILPELTTPEDAAGLARRIIAAVGAPVPLYEHEVKVGATIGIAVYPEDGDTGSALVKNADAAMYNAKQAGRGTHAFYRSAMNERALTRLNLETDLARAFQNGEFQVHYQPRLDARTRRVVAAEALLRWFSPSRGLVAPLDFIPVLEETGMIHLVGEWVLRTACEQHRNWADAGFAPVRISVNISARQFQSPGFAATVTRVLAETGVQPDAIELELTESLLITNPQQAAASLKALKALGLRLAIDDFGVGYSSLGYLREFEVDCLKIDRSFVSDVTSNPRDRALAAAIVQLAGSLEMSVVAEGVETDAQATFFTELECNELQGFLFCRPQPAEQIGRYLLGSSRLPHATGGVNVPRNAVAGPLEQTL